MRTALYDAHLALGAKMVTFSGWEMPLYYSGVLVEHFAVRRAVALFDVSHMGRIDVKGVDAELFFDYVSTNAMTDKPVNSVTYTVFSSESGGSIDDALVFRLGKEHFFAVVNAGNRETVLAHFRKIAVDYRVTVEPLFETEGILALQGPLARELLSRICGCEIPLKAMQCLSLAFADEELIISRTGYTGSFGYELLGSQVLIGKLWELLLKEGREEGILPAGLGARDTLRLEAGYALWGHELAPTIAPTESVSEWTVRWKKDGFLGKEALLRLEASSKKRSQHAVILSEKGIAREGNPVFKNKRPIGVVTSGTHSPCLGAGIALIMVTGNLAFGEVIEIEVRGHRHNAEVVKLPFYRV